MSQKWDGIEKRKFLRAEAEAMVARFYPEQQLNHTPEKLLHELLVHKIELELQNEELRLSYVAMEEMRDRYFDLYEFAPIGYLTVNREGLIVEINQTGSALLGVERYRLIDQRFTKLVASVEQDHWHLLFIKMLASAKNEKHVFDLALIHAAHAEPQDVLKCQCWAVWDKSDSLRIAFTDSTKPS